MKKPKYTIELCRSKKTGEFYIRPVSKNGKEIMKETYKSKSATKKTIQSFVDAIRDFDFEFVDMTKPSNATQVLRKTSNEWQGLEKAIMNNPPKLVKYNGKLKQGDLERFAKKLMNSKPKRINF